MAVYAVWVFGEDQQECEEEAKRMALTLGIADPVVVRVTRVVGRKSEGTMWSVVLSNGPEEAAVEAARPRRKR